MKNFLHICSGINVTPLAMALNLRPDLWNHHNGRKEFEGTSHACTSDIWIRFRDIKDLGEDYAKFAAEPHESVWYPAYRDLPMLRPLIFGLMAKCEAVQLGGVLITRIPPGGRVLPHTDRGWHPERYNMKVYVPILTNPQCVNRVEDEYVVMNPGEAWYFDNTVEHEVINDGPTERITLIVCMRVES